MPNPIKRKKTTLLNSGIPILILLIPVILLFGCIQPLDLEMVTIAKDEFAPQITLLPPDGNVYRSTLTVTGSVEDYTDADGTKSGDVRSDSLSWGILNKAAAMYNGSFVLDSNNEFTISIDTSDLSEIIVLRVSAIDLSGNMGSADITLEPYLQGPYIIITSPQDNDEWANELAKTVTGRAQNSALDSGVEEVDFDTLSVYVTQSENSEANPGNLITDETDGGFTFSFATDGLSSRQPITVSVSDLNGIEYQKIIYIVSSSEGPHIEITSPAERSIYGSLVEVAGSVRASGETDSGTTGITSLEVSLVGDESSRCTYVLDTATGLWTDTVPAGFTLSWDCGIIAGETDGDFFFSFYTAGLENDQLIEVVALNINGRQSVDTLTLLDDNEGPYVEVYTPDEMSFYYDAISITGIVTDADAVAPIDPTDIDDVGSVTWEILSEAEGGTLYIGSDGTFTINGIDSTGYTGNKTIKITAEDLNFNTSVAYRTLLEHTGGPSISLENPSCYPYYDHLFTLNGSVSHDGGLGQVDQTAGSLQWQFAGDPSWTDFSIDGSGVFSIGPIDTTGRSATQTIRVRAMDLNGDIGQGELFLLNDGIGVDLAIVSPATGSNYASVVPVEVDISDYADLAAADYLTWELIGQGANGTFTDNGNGNYTAVIDTGSYSSDLTLRITATDVHSNITYEEIGLLYGESTIPTFSVESANSSVIPTWEAVPLATSYNVYYTTDGSTPLLGLGSYPSGGTNKVANIFSGDTESITGLQNGDRHVFILEAELSGGYDPSISEEVVAVPLSPLSYCPTLRQEEPGSVIVEWPDYGGETEFTVWRSLDKGTSWQKISGQLTVSQFIDNGVSDGSVAWYKVKPVYYSNVESYYSAVNVHYLDTAAQFSSANNIIQDLKYHMIYFEYDSKMYLASMTAASGGTNRQIQIYDTTNPKAIAAAATSTISESITKTPQRYIAAAENYIFLVSEDLESNGHQLEVYNFDPVANTITHDQTLPGISYGGTILNGEIDGISAWYGDEGDGDAMSEFWVFINSGYISGETAGMFIIKVIPGVSAAVENLVDVATVDRGFDSEPLIYSEDDGAGVVEKISVFDNDTFDIQTLADFPSYNLSSISVSDFGGYAMTNPPGEAFYFATDGDNFFVVDGNTIHAYDEADPLNYATYTLLQQPTFIDITNGYLIAGADDLFLTSFDISKIDYVTHTMEVDRKWQTLYGEGVCSSGIAFLSTTWKKTIDIINIGSPALAITPYNSVSGSALNELNLEQNVLYGDLLYTYNGSTGAVRRWELNDLQNGLPPVPADEVAATILSGGLFAAGGYCFGVRDALYRTDFTSGSTAIFDFQSHPDVGIINAQGQFQTTERFGHYLFTGGLVTLGSPRVLGTYDIGSLTSGNLELRSYSYEATGGWLNLLRTGNYIISLQTESEELVITDVSNWEDIQTVNRIDVPGTVGSFVNRFTFLPYDGYVFFNYFAGGFPAEVYLLALDIDQLETATWDDLVEIDMFTVDPNYDHYLTTALCASGDYLFTAYSSLRGDTTDGICGIRSYKLADAADQIRIDGVYAYPDSPEIGNPIGGLRTDGEYLYLIRGDSAAGYNGGIEVFSIDENF